MYGVTFYGTNRTILTQVAQTFWADMEPVQGSGWMVCTENGSNSLPGPAVLLVHAE